MITTPKELEKVCVEAAEAGGKTAAAYFKSGRAPRFKTDARDSVSIVTEADLASEAAIRKIILASFPGHAIVGEEEGGVEGKGYSWFVDPVDGTMNFSRGWEIWGVSVGVAHEGRPVAAALYFPQLKKLFQAAENKGAQLNGKPTRTTGRTLTDAMAITSGLSSVDHALRHSVTAALTGRVAGLRSLGCATYSCALVAEGCADVNLIFDHSPWDVCAGALIIKEAGGAVKNLNGSDWTTADRDLISAANPKLYADIAALLRGK